MRLESRSKCMGRRSFTIGTSDMNGLVFAMWISKQIVKTQSRVKPGLVGGSSNFLELRCLIV